MSKSFKSKISIICVVCLLTCMFCMLGAYAVSEDAPEAEVVYSKVPMYINGIMVADGFKVEETTYAPLRAFMDFMDAQTDIVWDAETQTVSISGEGLTITAVVGAQYFTANDRCFYLPNGVLSIENSVCVPVRELAKVFGIDEIEWDAESSCVSISADETVLLQSGNDFYAEEDLYWLSRLINAESGNQPLDGKLAVGNVVMNRVADETCPDTIYGVIFDKRYGVQFSVIEGGIYAEPNEESVVAAKLCLEGYNIVPGTIYFVNPDIGATSWFSRTRVFVASIGEHDFYA